jgi:ribonuclease Y
VGATPVPCESDPQTYNLDPARISALVTPRTKAILPIHLYGQTADMEAINAIAAHHQEVEYTCQEAPIVQMADAISASRPGARGETMDTYLKRLTDLQAIADAFPGVERSFAVQAGREVRILVKPNEIDDLASGRLAHIVRRSGDPDVSGQIK